MSSTSRPNPNANLAHAGPPKVRPLGVLLGRILLRETRIELLRCLSAPASLIALEGDVLRELKREYTLRSARLNLYMGLA